MPTYKFFETSKETTIKEPQFEQFNLRTIQRSKSRTRQTLPDSSEIDPQTYVFKAAKMPDFSDNYNGVKPPSPKKLTNFTPFNLSTMNRGEDKQAKFETVVQKVKESIKESAQFKATPVKMNKDVVIPDRVKSEKKITKAVSMRLVSNDRSLKRELFDQSMREKELA